MLSRHAQREIEQLQTSGSNSVGWRSQRVYCQCDKTLANLHSVNYMLTSGWTSQGHAAVTLCSSILGLW